MRARLHRLVFVAYVHMPEIGGQACLSDSFHGPCWRCRLAIGVDRVFNRVLRKLAR